MSPRFALIGLLVLSLLGVHLRAEELGTLERSVARQMIERKGYKGAEITDADKTPYTSDGRPGWMVTVRFVGSNNKTYVARLWVNKVWSTGSVISVQEA